MRFQASAEFAAKLDKRDPLKKYRKQFYFPMRKGKKSIYFCGNSLGLQPKQTASAIKQELKDWKNLAIGGLFWRKKSLVVLPQSFQTLPVKNHGLPAG